MIFWNTPVTTHKPTENMFVIQNKDTFSYFQFHFLKVKRGRESNSPEKEVQTYLTVGYFRIFFSGQKAHLWENVTLSRQKSISKKKWDGCKHEKEQTTKKTARQLSTTYHQLSASFWQICRQVEIPLPKVIIIIRIKVNTTACRQ